MPSVPRARALVSGRFVPGRRQRGVAETPNEDQRSAIVDCAIYRDGCRAPEALDWRSAIDEVESSGEGFVWIGMHEPDETQFAGVAQLA
ncbi:MAG TPA: magnesium transporter, partial [Jatrophihabitans sp.]